MKFLFLIVRFFLFRMTPEKAFDVTIRALEFRRAHFGGHVPKSCPTKWMGLDLDNPVGIAAGMDKNGLYIDTLGALGVGFIEVGSATLKPQSGNPSGTITRIPGGLINDLGMPNEGIYDIVYNIMQSKWIERYTGKIGLSLAKNNTSGWDVAGDEFVQCMEASWYAVDYWTLNISCPNVNIMGGMYENVHDILAAVSAKQAEISERHDKYVPVAVKISPSLTHGHLYIIMDAVNANFIDGVIVSNTVPSSGGGESGNGIKEYATIKLENAATLIDNAEIGASGGIMNMMDAQSRFVIGATVIQLHTGLIFTGPTLVDDVIEAKRNVEN